MIRRSNDTNYGLAAGVCTRDIGTALSMSNRLRAGTVWINCYDKCAPLLLGQCSY